MHFQLGQKFRETYVNTLKFLPSSYPNSSTIYVRSTDVPRTVASAGSQLLGFFPATSSPLTEAININVVEAAMEDMAPRSGYYFLCVQFECSMDFNVYLRLSDILYVYACSGKCAKMVSQCNEVQNTTTRTTRTILHNQENP
jgi:hypothetical protein